jgi:hypothetical protein
MDTRRASERSRITRFAVAGALAVVVLFAGVGLESAASTAGASTAHRAAIVAHESRATLVAATAARTRGSAWVASLAGSIVCAALGAQLLRSIRRGNRRRDLRQLSFRLRAPPRLVVAH